MKYLDLTGLAYFWSKIKALLSNKQDVLSFDNIPTSGSTNPVTSGGIHSYYNNKEKVIAAALNDLEARKLNASEIGTDEVPTEDSTNFVTSGGLYNVITENEEIVASAINDLNDKKANISSLSPVATSGSYNDLTNKPVIPNVTVDSELDSDSENPVQNKVIDEALTEIKTDYAKLANVLIPNFDGMTPIKTIELDKAAANYSQLFTRKNTGISTTMSEVQDVVLMRITVTGTNIYSRSDVIIKFQPGLVNPHAYAFHDTYSSTAATTGIHYLRFNYPKALNNNIPWMVDFYQYNATSRHYKIEVFATTENITWEETLTSTTYNSTNYGTAQITLYANRGLCWLGTLPGYINYANSASYINAYLPKFVNANAIKAGEALVAYNIAFFNKGFAYKISNKDVAIDTDCGICSIGTTYALNATISYPYLRSIWSFTFTSPANHGLTYDTFVQGDRVYLRCTIRNGKIYSDAYLAKEMTPGYTWYLLGVAYNATNGFDMNTTGSMFITLDESGLISYINGKPTQAILMVDGIDQENTFLKRNTPDSSVEVKNIGGNSIVWNQMMPNTGSSSPYTGVQGVTLGRKDGNILYISGNATSAAELTFPTSGNITTIVGHVYLIHLDKEMPTGWYTGLSGSSVGTTTYGKSHITTCTSSNSYGVYICRTKNTPTGVDIDWEAHVSVFDLTQMFGAGNEPTSVDEFERMFAEPYYEYDEDTLLNLEMTGIKTEDSSSTQVSNVNFNVKTLQGIPNGGNTAETIFPNGMCGIGGVRDEIDFEAGKAIKRFGIVDIGSLTYTTDSLGFYTQQITDSKPYSSATPVSNLHILVNGYTKINVFSATIADKSVTLNSSYHAANKLYLKNTAYSTVADFKAAMSGVMLVYELADPVEYTITTNISTYNIVKGGCEKILPYDDNDVLTAPATMFAYYKSSFQEKLVSGENIKTINNQSLLGTGNITIQGGGSGDTNVIETIKVNGTALTPDANKAVNIPITNEKYGNGLAVQTDNGSTQNITASLTDYVLTNNGRVSVILTHDLPYGPTLNINNTGAKNIYDISGLVLTDSGKAYAGDIITVVYDGTNYKLIDVFHATEFSSYIESDPLILTLTDDSEEENIKLCTFARYSDHPVITPFDPFDPLDMIVYNDLIFSNPQRFEVAPGLEMWTFSSVSENPDNEKVALFLRIFHQWDPTYQGGIERTYIDTDYSPDIIEVLNLEGIVTKYAGEIDTHEGRELGNEPKIFRWVAMNYTFDGCTGGLVIEDSYESSSHVVTYRQTLLGYQKIYYRTSSTTDMSNSNWTEAQSGDTNIIESVKVNGTALAPDANKAVNITNIPASIVTQDTTHRFVSDTEKTTWNNKVSNVQADWNATSGLAQILNKPTIPAEVTESTVSGWGFTKNAGTVTGVKINGTTKNPTSGIVDLGTVLTSFTETDPTVPAWAKAANKPTYTATEVGALPDTTVIPAAPGTLNTTATTAQSTSSSEALSGNITLHKVAKTGTYNDLIGKPTIPSEVTESTVSGWGFTKNTGTYSKPSGGIPPTDLSSAVQTSLGKADTALQSYTETDPVFSASAAAGISSTDISNWNSKTSNVGTITGITMNGASKGTSGVVDLGTVITAHQSLSGKQDVINDLATIRSNASSGASAATTIAGYGDIVTHNASEFQTKIIVSSSNPSGGNNGDIWIVI